MTSLTLYGSSVAATTITTANKLSTTTGGTETSKTTTAPNDSSQNYMEFLSQGGSGTDSSSIPSPTGKGWLLDSTLLENCVMQSGNWSATMRMNDTANFASITFTMRFYKRSSGGTYTSIGTITSASQAMSSTTTSYSFAASSLGSMQFGVGDKLYVDVFGKPDVSDGHWTGDPIVVFLSNSGTAGVANDLQVTTPGYSTIVTKTVQTRLRLQTQVTKTLQSRIRLKVQQTKTVQARLIERVKNTLTLTARLRLQTQITRTLQNRLILKVQRTLTLQARFVLQHPITKTLAIRFLERVTTTVTLTVRSRLATLKTGTLQTRLVMTRYTRVVTTRFLERTQVTKTLQNRIRLVTKVSKTLAIRFLERTQVTKTLQVRFRYAGLVTKTLQFRAKITIKGVRTLQFRLNLTGPRILSGGGTLFANTASGTATFDNFRWTQFPDPALSLAPIIPRLGSTGIVWNALVPGLTTLGMDTSIDGVTWTDVTSQNGRSIPGLFSQVDPVIDGFSTNTSGNYTSTFRTGGAVASWTYDTSNSRVLVTGGTNALFIYTALSRADVDIFGDMDCSDAGGLVWRYIDQSNFYYVLIGDTSASVASPNSLTVYKVASNTATSLGSTQIAIAGTPLSTFIRGTFHRIRVSMLAGVITVSVDGVTQLTITDNSPLGSGKIGLYSNGGAVGARFYQLWMTQIGDNVTGTPAGDIATGTFLYTRERLATTNPTETPQVEDLTTYAFTPQISAGVSIPSVTYTASSIARNYDDLAKQSNYYWYIDQNKTFNFRLLQSVPAPWILQSAPAGLMSDVDLIAPTGKTRGNNFELDVANDLYRNRQTILGAQDTVSPPTASFVGDGNTRSFTLGYPVGATPTITVNGNTQTVSTKGNTGFQWYWAYNDAVLEQDSNNNNLTANDQLLVTYTGLVDVLVQVDDVAEQTTRAGIEGGTGVVESVEDHSTDTPRPLKNAAITLAQQLIARYAISGRTFIFDTTRNGLVVGQLLTIFLPEHGIWDGQFLITQVEITLQKAPGDTQIWWYKVTASELPKQASWAKLIASGLGLK